MTTIRHITEEGVKKVVNYVGTMQVMKNSNTKIPTELEQKLRQHATVKPAFDASRNAIYLLLSYKNGEGTGSMIVYSQKYVPEGIERSEMMQGYASTAKGLVTDRQRLVEILQKYIAKGTTIGDISYANQH